MLQPIKQAFVSINTSGNNKNSILSPEMWTIFSNVMQNDVIII